MDVLLNYHKDMHGKEVIDTSGNVIGKVKDISWNEETKEIKFFEVGSSGIMDIFGRGESKILPFDMISTIGEKILIKSEPNEISKEDNPKVVSSSGVEDNSKVTRSSRIKDISKVKDSSKFSISKVKDISKNKGFSMNKKTKNVEDVGENGNIDDIEDTIEDFRIRNSF